MFGFYENRTRKSANRVFAVQPFRNEGKKEERWRNSIISLPGCHVGAAVARQVFSFITYESGRPPNGPWDQTGFPTRCGNRIHADPVRSPRYFDRGKYSFPIHLTSVSLGQLRLDFQPRTQCKNRQIGSRWTIPIKPETCRMFHGITNWPVWTNYLFFRDDNERLWDN